MFIPGSPGALRGPPGVSPGAVTFLYLSLYSKCEFSPSGFWGPRGGGRVGGPCTAKNMNKKYVRVAEHDTAFLKYGMCGRNVPVLAEKVRFLIRLRDCISLYLSLSLHFHPLSSPPSSPLSSPLSLPPRSPSSPLMSPPSSFLFLLSSLLSSPHLMPWPAAGPEAE